MPPIPAQEVIQTVSQHAVQIVAPVRQGALLVWNGRIVLPSLNPGVDSAVADVNHAPYAHDESLARNAIRLPCTTLGRSKQARRAAAVQFQVPGLDALRADAARHFFEPAELAERIVSPAEHSPFTRTQRNPSGFVLDSSHVLLINNEGVDGLYMRPVQRIVTIDRGTRP